jgi:glycosyltransferase involved in cell wall biosynthesis
MFVIRSLANSHGVERTIIDKANYLAANGHRVMLLTYEQGRHPYAFTVSRDVECVDLDCRYFTIFRYPLPQRMYIAWKMRKMFAERIKSRVDEWHPDVLVAATYEGEFMRTIVSLKTQTHVVLESHTAFEGHLIGKGIIERIRKKRILQNIKRCNMLIALTHRDAEVWRLYIQNVKAVPNPLVYFPKDVSGIEKIKGRIIAVGRLYSEKRFDRLIDAFSLIAEKYPEWFIDIYGEGPDEQVLKHQIDRQKLVGRVNLKGVTKDVYSEYLKSQFFVLSSDSEGFGLVLIEAMSCGIPVVSTNCPFGPVEIVEDGVTGLLTKLAPADMAEKMEWMINHAEQRNEMGQRARETVKRYQAETVMTEWEQAYLSVLQ